MSSSNATPAMGSAAATGRLPYLRGFAAGAGAALLTYLVTYVWQVEPIREQLEGVNFLLEFFGGQTIPGWKAVGWLAFNAHFVAFVRPEIGGGTTSQSFIASGESPALLYALPVALLLAAGFGLTWMDRRGAGRLGGTSPGRGAAVGATTAVGYLPLAVGGVFLFTVTRGDATIQPDPVTGILLAGVVYPLVLGTVGGVLGAALKQRR